MKSTAQMLTIEQLYIYLRFDVDSILEAVLTVSPNKQYLGIVCPTTPATTDPVK